MTKSLHYKSVYKYLDEGKTIYALTKVSNPHILMKMLRHSDINKDFFKKEWENFWSYNNEKEVNMTITQDKSKEQINIQIIPILYKKEIYSGYIPDFFLTNFMVDLKLKTKTFYSLNRLNQL